MGWKIVHEERDGELVSVPRYENNESIYDTKDEYDISMQCREESRKALDEKK